MRQVQTHYYAIRHYARSILVFLTMIFTNSAFEVTTVWRYRNLIIIIIISCLSTYPLRACQWLSNVPGVGLLVMMIWLELCTSRSCICHHHLSHYNKVQNGDILVSADPDLSLKNGRWNGEREHLGVWSAVGVSDHILYVSCTVCIPTSKDTPVS